MGDVLDRRVEAGKEIWLDWNSFMVQKADEAVTELLEAADEQVDYEAAVRVLGSKVRDCCGDGDCQWDLDIARRVVLAALGREDR